MDTKDTDVKTAAEAPAMPAPEWGPVPGPRALPSLPLHWPVDQAEDSLEMLRAAYQWSLDWWWKL